MKKLTNTLKYLRGQSRMNRFTLLFMMICMYQSGLYHDVPSDKYGIIMVATMFGILLIQGFYFPNPDRDETSDKN